jgi:hypothetical protein
MDTIHSWLDPQEVRRLADRLMNQNHSASETPAALDFDKGFVGFAADSVPSPVVIAPAVPQVIEKIAEPALEPVAVASLTPDEASTEPSLAKNQEFSEWLSRSFSATGTFILDQQGAVIFNEIEGERLHFIARSVVLASRRNGHAIGNVRLRISTEEVLEIIPVETTQGLLVLGTSVPHPLDPDSVMKVRRAVFQLPHLPMKA